MAAADRIVAARAAHVDPCTAVGGVVLAVFEFGFQGIDLFDRTGLQCIDFLTQFPFHFGGHGFEFVQDVVELTLTAEQPHAELFDLRRSLRFELFNPFEQVVYFLNHLYCWLFFRYIYTL